MTDHSRSEARAAELRATSLACLVTAGSLVCLGQLGLAGTGGGVLEPARMLPLAGLLLANVAGWKLRHEVRRLARGGPLQGGL